MDRRANAFITGLFVLGLGAAAILAMIWLGNTTQRRLPYVIYTEGDVGGLAPYSIVRYRGVQVGQVRTVDFAEQGQEILINIVVDAEVPLTVDTYATLRTLGLTGRSQISLQDDEPGGPRLRTSPEDPARIPMQPSLIQQASDVAEELMKNLQSTAGNMQKLLTPENMAQVEQILGNVRELTADLAKLDQQINPVMARLPALVDRADDSLARVDSALAVMEQSLINVRDVTARAQEVVDLAGSAGEEALLSTLPAATAALAELRQAALSVQQTSRQLQQDPASLLYGRGRIDPGPGESGYGSAP